MPVKKLYVNISSEQDLITLLGSRLVEEFQALEYSIFGLVLGDKEDSGLRGILEKHGVGLRFMPYKRNRAAKALASVIGRLRKIQYYGKSSFDSTLFAKSKMRYRGGTYNLPKFWAMKLLSKALACTRLLHAPVIGLYHRSATGLGELDAPVISLDYIHNDDHLELSLLARRQGMPYISYVANLDQVTNYSIHLDIPDKILVWGDFHRNVFTCRFGIDPAKIGKVGFCRSDKIAHIASAARDHLNVVYFCANIPENDPFFKDNLRHMIAALDEIGRPYDFTMKKHPVNEKGLWEDYVAALQALSPRHGTINLVASTWEKYSKLDQGGLGRKDFSYSDLRALMECATHVFSATSTTTLEAAIAGVPAYFVNLEHKLDGCFRFEHMRALMESGMVGMVTDPADFRKIFSEAKPRRATRNSLMENIGCASRAFAQNVDRILYPAPASRKREIISIPPGKS